MNINLLRKKFLKVQKKNKDKFSLGFINKLLESKYVYHFNWMGIPIIQFPSDLIVMQELIYDRKPDIIIETGVAHGGGLLFYASILNNIKNHFKIFGIDIKIKKSNKRKIIQKKKLIKNIQLIEKSSTDLSVIKLLKENCKNKKTIVILDSNHSHSHVLNELNLYSNFIKKNDYIIVLDTITEFIDQKFINKNRNFEKGNSPYTAVKEFLKKNKNFKVDKFYENKSFICGAMNGFLKRVC